MSSNSVKNGGVGTVSEVAQTVAPILSAEEKLMGERVPPSNYPWWVKVSMWGGLKRTGLWVFVALSIAAAVASFVYGFWDQRFYYLGPAFLVAALMYWLSIRWVDRYGSWTEGA